ncbi:MAG TPA: carboxylating nicotinate-nucleotide diphosphorylase [Bdellovibrionales bacterium]|nr:carboxylating nicotinate-nucleotide diphosphorylase [Bdellovibrionales bacterium]
MNIDQLIEAAFLEDLPSGDITTDALELGPVPGQARLLAKEDLVLSGREVFEKCIRYQEPEAELKWLFDDGDMCLKNQIICTIKGDFAKLLKAERTALNFIGHLSGVATLTRCFVQKVAHTQTKILDTRKTLPGYRELEKKAVADGGGQNHRLNLSDKVMIKDNHIAAAGGITSAVERVRAKGHKFIEVEARTLEEVDEAVKNKVSQILLDNMSVETMKKALQLIPRDIKTEASGNMTIDRVAAVAETGVNFISVGALTHSAPNADISMKIEWPLRR